MFEVQQKYKQIKQLKAENLKLTMLDPKVVFPGATLLFGLSMLIKSTSLSTLSLGIGVCSLLQIASEDNISQRKKRNRDCYFDTACQLHEAIQKGVRAAFCELNNEKNPKRRSEIMRSVRWMKSIDIIRNVDKKEVVSTIGRRQKGLARGLKDLRHRATSMTRDEYILSRENIFSYY